MKNILVIAAHPDDETLGVGATIDKHIKNGDNVSIIIFSEGHTPIQPNLKKYAHESLLSYGIPRKNVFWLGCKSGEFELESKIPLNTKLTNIVLEINPDIVYTQFYGDTHQDHRVVFDSTMVACRPSHQDRGTNIVDNKKNIKILCYEIPSSTHWSGRLDNPFNPTEFQIVTQENLENKIKAYSFYKGEVRSDNNPRSIESIYTLAKFRGNSVGEKFAEAFIVIRNVLK